MQTDWLSIDGTLFVERLLWERPEEPTQQTDCGVVVYHTPWSAVRAEDVPYGWYLMIADEVQNDNDDRAHSLLHGAITHWGGDDDWSESWIYNTARGFGLTGVAVLTAARVYAALWHCPQGTLDGRLSQENAEDVRLRVCTAMCAVGVVDRDMSVAQAGKLLSLVTGLKKADIIERTQQLLDTDEVLVRRVVNTSSLASHDTFPTISHQEK